MGEARCWDSGHGYLPLQSQCGPESAATTPASIAIGCPGGVAFLGEPESNKSNCEREGRTSKNPKRCGAGAFLRVQMPRLSRSLSRLQTDEARERLPTRPSDHGRPIESKPFCFAFPLMEDTRISINIDTGLRFGAGGFECQDHPSHRQASKQPAANGQEGPFELAAGQR